MRKCDTHVHSWRSFVGNCDMTLEKIDHQAQKLGIQVVAITDHLIKPEDINELKVAYDSILAYRTKRPKTRILTGVEICEYRENGSLLLDPGLKRDLRWDLAIGGIHETHAEPGASLEKVAVLQHKHQMMMMENPLIQILVHPWWLDKGEFERLGIPWPEDMSFIPKELTVDLAPASKRTNTYIEISTMSGLCNRDTSAKFKKEWEDYYRLLYQEGALFAIGTDAHQISEMETYKEAEKMVKKIGIPEERFWQPEPWEC